MEETTRKLASIQRIIDIQPIEGSDFLEVATILGWHVVVLKSENYKVGDNVVYCEVDSLLPLWPEFEFLAKGSSPKKMLIDGKEIEGHRIKTIRLRGALSQGIVFPLSLIAEALHMEEGGDSFTKDELDNPGQFFEEGKDVTKLLNIYKYEIPLPAQLAGKARSGFPGFIPRTDEPRLQGIPKLLELYKDETFYVTEKMDGSSCTIFIKNGEFHVCGRTIDWLDDGGNSYWQVAKAMEVEKKLREFGYDDRIALQGELVGPNIQKNTLKFSDLTLRFFNAYDFSAGEYLNYFNFVELMKELDLPIVPIIDASFKLLPTVDEMVTYATRKSIQNPDVWLEGLVFRPLVERKDADLGRLSFKVLNPEYLLKHE